MTRLVEEKGREIEKMNEMNRMREEMVSRAPRPRIPYASSQSRGEISGLLVKQWMEKRRQDAGLAD